MITHGELKREVPDMSDEALDTLRRECIELIRDGIKPTAERELLRAVRRERVARRSR